MKFDLNMQPLCAALACGLLLASCTSRSAEAPAGALPAPSASSDAEMVADEPVKIGGPYSVGGQQFVPRDAADFDEVGYASWYGKERAGQPTANGEIFRPEWPTAAHATLPLPSYVEVSALDTGRTILVRINDRGPFSSGRVIDLSAAAATALGIAEQGLAPVRVRRVNPPEGDRRALRSGRLATERLPTDQALLGILRSRIPPRPTSSGGIATTGIKPVDLPPAKPATPSQKSVASTAPTRAARQAFAVQLGAFTDRSRAEALVRQLGDGAAIVAGGPPYRVQMPAGTTRKEAEAKAATLRGKGLKAIVVGPR